MWQPQNDLERALQDSRKGHVEASVFHRELKEGILIFLTPYQPWKAGTYDVGPDKQKTFVLWPVEGENMVVLFTSTVRVEYFLRNIPDWHKHFIMGEMLGQELLQVLLTLPNAPKAILNPCGEDESPIMEPAWMREIVEWSVLDMPTPDDAALVDVVLPPPEQIPDWLRESLCKYLATRPEVQAAWLFYDEQPAPPYNEVLLVWVLMTGGDVAEVERETALAIAGVLPPQYSSRAWVIKNPQVREVQRVMSLIRPFYAAPDYCRPEPQA